MRAIDADRLKRSFEANTPIAFQDCVPGIHAIIDLEPTVEAIPVIRCKDCKYWGEDGYRNGCRYANCIMEENDYCSMAERKEMGDKKTCYNCKHGAFGFDGDLGCSLWHRGIYDQKICGCWEGFERKEE